MGKIIEKEEIMKEWNWEKNNRLGIDPNKLTWSSTKKVWWQCEKGHEYQTTIALRVYQKTGCPYCSGRLLEGYNDLATLRPDIAKEWHPTKNGKLQPNQITSAIKKKVWWQCEKGHEWEACVGDRTVKNSRCPYCVGKKVIKGYNDLATLRPDLAKEWNFLKNGELTPSDVSLYSSKNVWWKCQYKHEWKTKISTRTANGSNCPYCAGKKTIIGENDLLTLRPDLAKEWHPTKNGKLLPNQVKIGSAKKVWWKCEKGHEWKSIVYDRCLKHSNCPYCAGTGMSLPEKIIYYYLNKTLTEEVFYRYHNFGFEIDIFIPNLMVGIEYDGNYYHDDKKDIKKNKLCAEKGIKLYRIREKPLSSLNSSSIDFVYNYKQQNELVIILKQIIYELYKKDVDINILRDLADISNIANMLKSKNSVATVYPNVAKEWHPTKNGKLLPSHFSYGSEQIVWWQDKLGHEWTASIKNRTIQGQGCPYCSNHTVLIGFNDLATTYPEVAKEWHPTKNGNVKPTDVTSGSDKKIWWIDKLGHEWKTEVKNRTKGCGCPYCHNRKVLIGFNDLATTRPNLLKEWDFQKNKILPTQVVKGSNKKVWWICSTCGHEWQATISERSQGHGCSICGKKQMVETKRKKKTE